jgi:hypothetical protein
MLAFANIISFVSNMRLLVERVHEEEIAQSNPSGAQFHL